MPTLATIAAIAGLVSAGVGVGTEVYSLANKPSAPKPTAPTPPTAAQQNQTKLAQQAAVSQQLPTEEGLTSGFANPNYYAQQGALKAGVAGQPTGASDAAAAVEKAFGLPAGSLSGGAGGGGVPGTPKDFKPVGTGQANAGAFPKDKVDLSDFVNSFIST